MILQTIVFAAIGLLLVFIWFQLLRIRNVKERLVYVSLFLVFCLFSQYLYFGMARNFELNRAVYGLVDVADLIEKENGSAVIEPIRTLENNFNEGKMSTDKALAESWHEIKKLNEAEPVGVVNEEAAPPRD